jgi:hypothetical protein
MSRWVYSLGVGVALVALAFVVTDWVIGPTPGVTEANVRRIRMGMRVAEVDALLGGPAPFTKYEDFFTESETRILIYCWWGETGKALVFTQEKSGRVLCAEWEPSDEPRPSPLSRLRSWFGW